MGLFLRKEDQNHGRSEASRVRDETFFPRGLWAVERCHDCLRFYEVVIERPQLSVRKDILARLECCICGEEEDDECLEEKIEGIIARVFEDRDGRNMNGVD